MKFTAGRLGGLPRIWIGGPDCLDPESSVSESIHELARVITGESELPYEPYEEGEIDRTVQRLSRALSWKRS